MTTKHDPTSDEALGGGHAGPAQHPDVPPPGDPPPDEDAGEVLEGEGAGTGAPVAGPSPDEDAGEVLEGEGAGTDALAVGSSPDGDAGEVLEGEGAGTGAPVAGSSSDAADEGPLADRSRQWTDRWNEIQTGFVDEPRQSVERADALVDEVVTELTAALASERSRLETEWKADHEPSTEDLRVALQHYRSFFGRLLAAT